eukprot:Selendium_serpulae@DN7143_c0_g1_i1.p1
MAVLMDGGVPVKDKGTFFRLKTSETTKLGNKSADGIKREVVWHRVPLPDDELHEQSDPLVILIVGQTGVGKSTQINAWTNWLLGVTPNCNHRFTLIADVPNSQQGCSVTQEVNCYTIPALTGSRLDRPVCLIDCPGSNDTRGIPCTLR